MTSLPLLPSFRRQQLLLDYAALKHRCPEGIYLSPSTSDPSLWAGVFFVRKGPYSSAILRFEISFPNKYPDIPPLLTCSTEIFHPLLVPLTTYTLGISAFDPSTGNGASDTTRLSPGSFSLRHGFPEWFRLGRGRASLRTSSIDSGTSPNAIPTPQERAVISDKHQISVNQEDKLPIIAVLEYFKSAFEDASLLDTVPLEYAGNQSAWHAWRAHRGLGHTNSRSASPASIGSARTPSSPARHPGEWNWDGVWEARVSNGIEESSSELSLFGSKNTRNVISFAEMIRFGKYDEDKLQDMQDAMIRLHAFNRLE